MVTETPEEDGMPRRVGAVASLGGAVEDLYATVVRATTSGHRKVFWPLVLLLLAVVLIVTGLAVEGWPRAVTVVALVLVAIWAVADDVRG